MRKTTITKITVQTRRRTILQFPGGQPVDKVADDKQAVVPVRQSKEIKENKVNE
jgi:hypothetical protein